jgi:hypothetical protein
MQEGRGPEQDEEQRCARRHGDGIWRKACQQWDIRHPADQGLQAKASRKRAEALGNPRPKPLLTLPVHGHRFPHLECVVVD